MPSYRIEGEAYLLPPKVIILSVHSASHSLSFSLLPSFLCPFSPHLSLAHSVPVPGVGARGTCGLHALYRPLELILFVYLFVHKNFPC